MVEKENPVGLAALSFGMVFALTRAAMKYHVTLQMSAGMHIAERRHLVTRSILCASCCASLANQ
jgi:hypothetical protein